jgi:hypothetical protein
MTTGATGQLGLALPVQGELSGTWGDTVNNGITQYTNIAIAGTLSFAGDGAITLANTTGDASATNIGSTTAQYMVIRVTGTLTTAKVITGPSYSKLYLVDNAATGSTVTFKAAGQTGISIAAGETCFAYYNGTDYIKVTSDLLLGGYTTTATAGTTTTLTAASTTTQFFTGTLTQTVVLPVASTLVLGAAFAVHNNSTGDITVNSSGSNLVATVTANTTCLFTCILTSGTSAASWDADYTGFTLTLPTVRGGTGLTSFTANGVVYASSTSALATGSALAFDGTSLVTPNLLVNGYSGIALRNDVAGSYLTYNYNSGRTNAADNVWFNGISTELMRLTSTGLGIGTSSPAYKLDVQQSGTAVARIGTTNGSGSPGSALILQGSVASKNWLIGSSYYATSGGLEFTPSTTNGGTTFTTPSMTLDSAGYLSGVWADKVSALGNSGTAKTITCTAGNVFTATLTGNCTFTLSAPSSTTASTATSFTLILTNDATAGRTVALAGGTFKAPGGSVTRTTTANATDIWFFFSPDGGTTWYYSIPMANLS